MGNFIGLHNWEIQVVEISSALFAPKESNDMTENLKTNLCLVLFSDNFSPRGSKMAARCSKLAWFI